MILAVIFDLDGTLVETELRNLKPTPGSSGFAGIVKAVEKTMFGDFSVMFLHKVVHALPCTSEHWVEIVIKEDSSTTREMRPDSLRRKHQAIP